MVLALVEQGLNDCEIARRTGIPRRTVLDWRHGVVPRQRQRPRGSAPDSCPDCGHPVHDPALLPARSYAYLLGMYLGDGCISIARRKVFRLRITLDSRYPKIIEECATVMSDLMPASRVLVLPRRGENAVEVGSYSRSWPCLFPQHGVGRKHHRRIQLAPWQQAIAAAHPRPLLRGLIHSDGCHSVNTIKHPKKTYVYPRYLFSNRSPDIRKIFCDACDQLGIAWRQMTTFDVSVAQRDSVAMLDEFIGPKE